MGIVRGARETESWHLKGIMEILLRSMTWDGRVKRVVKANWLRVIRRPAIGVSLAEGSGMGEVEGNAPLDGRSLGVYS
jgi:hypothetical protein